MKDRPPYAELLRNSNGGIEERSKVDGWKVASLTYSSSESETGRSGRPNRSWERSFHGQSPKDLLDPPGKAPVIIGSFVEVDLLECRRFRFHQHIVAYQCLPAACTEPKLVHGIGINQPSELVLALRLAVTLRRCFELGND